MDRIADYPMDFVDSTRGKVNLVTAAERIASIVTSVVKDFTVNENKNKAVFVPKNLFDHMAINVFATCNNEQPSLTSFRAEQALVTVGHSEEIG